MKYTRPDLMYVVNRLRSYADDPYAPASQGINHLISYLAGFPHRILYIPLALTELQPMTSVKGSPQATSPPIIHQMALLIFAYGGECLTPNTKCTISCLIFCLFKIDVHCP